MSRNSDNELMIVFGGFFLCLLGTIALLMGNVLGAVFLLGLGLIIVAVVAGLIEKLFDVFADILKSIFK